METYSYHVTGMDCPSCAAKIEKNVRKFAEINEVNVSIASQIMTLHTNDMSILPDVEQAIENIGYGIDRIDDSSGDAEEVSTMNHTHLIPTYKKALWIVILLNVGYGIIEMVGGFLAGSQALKADALDFLGDGLITFLGLIAIGWSLIWRARSALLQGIFLGAMGIGVVINVVYRLFVLQVPEAELMGVLGFIALIVNVVAAIVLIPHRTGDSNVRAVWLFSRNDAIGNLIVVIAAGIVIWTGSSYPDLIAACVIAGLFIQSAWLIIKDARNDLANQRKLYSNPNSSH